MKTPHSVRREIEIRAPASDFGAVVERLVERGFAEGSQSVQHDMMFDKSDGSLFRGGSKLRIRLQGEMAELTYKGPFSGDATASRRDEINVNIPSSEVPSAARLFAALGFPLLFQVKKERRVFERGDLSVVFDRWPILGVIIEIEGPEDGAKALALEIAPTTTFKNYRLKELFEKVMSERDCSIEQLKMQHLKEHGYDVGRIEVLL